MSGSRRVTVEYLAALLDVDLRCRRPPIGILSSMGAAELGFNLCVETQETVRLRQLAAADHRLREALFGHVDTVPMIGHYDPRRWFIELTETGELANGGMFAFTNLDLDAVMPLVRYRTGDCGYLLPARRVTEVLRDLKYSAYIPRRSDPLMALAGRSSQSVSVAGREVPVTFLRSLLYSDVQLAALTTGQFQASARHGKLHLQIQLSRDVDGKRLAGAQRQFSTLFNRHVPSSVTTVPFFEFRDALDVDYERKFQHIERNA